MLHDTFGGDIKLLNETNQKNIKTPDFIWRDKFWELKRAKSINSADKSLQHAFKQIEDNPGGVILNILVKNMELEKLERQLFSRFKRSNSISDFDLMLLEDGKLIKILRHKK